MRFVVDESKWLRGGKRPNGCESLTFLCNSFGEMCCLGFVAEKLGADIDGLERKAKPSNITPEYKTKEMVGVIVGRNGQDTLFSKVAMQINDEESISDTERKRQLRELAKKHGHTFTFIKGGK